MFSSLIRSFALPQIWMNVKQALRTVHKTLYVRIYWDLMNANAKLAIQNLAKNLNMGILKNVKRIRDLNAQISLSSLKKT